MNIFSSTILSFISLMKKYAFEIVRLEMNLKVSGKRFEYRGRLYPLNIVVFESKNHLGNFDASTFTIGINKIVMYSAKTHLIKNILRHELAHYFCNLKYGENNEPHGLEFKNLCKNFNWDEEVSKATFNLINEKIEGDLPTEKLIEKIKKLLNLANSANPHEAELATVKANNLIMAHNLERLEEKPDEFTYHQRILSGKRTNGKVRAIYEILKEFFVFPVISYGKSGYYLEVVGNKENVEVAEYVANFLDLELEKIWEAQKLSGISQKNSFMEGLAEEFIKKLRQEKEDFPERYLVKFNEVLQGQVALVYPRLSSRKFLNGYGCEKAKNLGRLEGTNLKIRKGLLNKKIFLLT